ncbi:unnamed protein product [Nezara viridula]|uniref:Uncharacterized protein n=1 Tax=Nezara viridula TaxID=85310 RepID=A0A9P0H3T8_NEZVI|nr:unnamed protein product [Nezara viridula]
MTKSNQPWVTRAEIGKDFVKMSCRAKAVVSTVFEAFFFQSIHLLQECRPTSEYQSNIQREDQNPMPGYHRPISSMHGLQTIKSILQDHQNKIRDTVWKDQIFSWGNQNGLT